MPRAYDRQQLTVDRDPLRQLDMSIGNLPTLTLDPAAILAAFVESIKTSTGIDLSSVDALIQSLGEVVAQFVDFLGSLLDPDTFFAALAEVITFFAGLLDRAGFLVILEEIVNFFGGLLDRAGFFDALNDVIGFFAGLLDRAGFLGVLEDVIGFFGSILDFSTWSAALKQFVDFFAGLLNPTGFINVLEDVVDFFGSLLDFSTWSAMLDEVVGFFSGITDFSNWSTRLKELVDWLAAMLNPSGFLTVLQDVVEFFATVTNFSTWSTQLKQLVDWLVAMLNPSGFLDILQDVVEFFATVIGNFGSLPDWLSRIPSLGADIIGQLWSLLNGGATAIGKTINDVLESIGSFVSALIPNLTGVPGALGLGDVSTWARNLLDKGLSWPDLKTLFGDIPASILGVLPIPNISLINPELMSQGGFNTSTTLAPGSGWTWDSATHSGSSGSAKVAGAATTRALYSNQAIEVAQGDKLLVSCWVKSTGTVGAGGIVLSIVEFNGTTQGTTRTIASRASSTPWVQIGDTVTSTYTVGAGVTSIRVRLAITPAAASGSSVWFDDISVKKTGLLDGSWMEGLLGTVVDDFQTIADSIAQAIQSVGTAGTGNALTTVLTNIQSIFSRLFGIVSLPASLLVTPLLEVAIPGLSGGKITSGSVNADFLPIDDIGAEINPGVGSGATLTRTGATTYNATTGRNTIGAGFYNNLSSSPDITALTSGGQYTGQFQVSMDGWYLCEISFRINPSAGYDWNIAPLLYKNGSPFRIGSDAMLVNAFVANAQRYAQSSFIVYLTAGQNVGAGYDASGAFSGIFSGAGTSVDTYFSVSLLNKSYA